MKTYITEDDVLRFNRQWPGSRIKVRRHFVEFDSIGNLVDCDFGEDEGNYEVQAIVQEAAR